MQIILFLSLISLNSIKASNNLLKENLIFGNISQERKFRKKLSDIYHPQTYKKQNKSFYNIS